MLNLDTEIGWIRIGSLITTRMIDGSFKHLLKEPYRRDISDQIKFINKELTIKAKKIRNYRQYVAIKKAAAKKFGNIEYDSDSSGISTDIDAKEEENNRRKIKKVRGKSRTKKLKEVSLQKNDYKGRKNSKVTISCNHKKTIVDKSSERSLNELENDFNEGTLNEFDKKSSRKFEQELDEDPLNKLDDELDGETSEEVDDELFEDPLNTINEKVIEDSSDEIDDELIEKIPDETDDELIEKDLDETDDELIEKVPDETDDELIKKALDEANDEFIEKVPDEIDVDLIKKDLDETNDELMEKVPDEIDVDLIKKGLDEAKDELIEKVLDETDDVLIEKALDETDDELIEKVPDQTDNELIKKALDEAKDELMEKVPDETDDELIEKALDETDDELIEKVPDQTDNELIEETQQKLDQLIEETQNKIDDDSMEEISETTDVKITDQSDSLISDELNDNIDDNSNRSIDNSLHKSTSQLTLYEFSQINSNNTETNENNQIGNTETAVRKDKPALKITSTEVIKPKYKIVRDLDKDEEKNVQIIDTSSELSDEDFINQRIFSSNAENGSNFLQVDDEQRELKSDNNSDFMYNEEVSLRKKERNKKKREKKSNNSDFMCNEEVSLQKKERNKKKRGKKSNSSCDDSDLEKNSNDQNDSDKNFSAVKNIEGRILENLTSEEEKNDDIDLNQFSIYERRRRRKKSRSSEQLAMNYILKNILERQQRETDVNLNVEMLPVDEFVHINNGEKFHSDDEEEEEEFDDRPKTLGEFAEIEELTPLSPIIISNALTIEDLSDNEEIFIMEVPTTINLKQYEGEHMSIKKNRLKIGNERYQLHNKSDKQITCIMRENGEEINFETVNINLQGSFVIKSHASELEAVKPYGHLNDENDNNDRVPFPRNLKIRNPLLGVQEKIEFCPQERRFAINNPEVHENLNIYKRKKLKLR